MNLFRIRFYLLLTDEFCFFYLLRIYLIISFHYRYPFPISIVENIGEEKLERSLIYPLYNEL